MFDDIFIVYEKKNYALQIIFYIQWQTNLLIEITYETCQLDHEDISRVFGE